MTLCIRGNEMPAVGQGCMGVGGWFAVDATRDAEQIAALRYGIELGMTFIDTAEVYGAGHSEELIGRAVAGIRAQVFLASKVSPTHLASPDLFNACEGTLARLGTDYLDLYQIHWSNPAVPLEETLGAMVQLVERGKVLHVGVSNFSLSEVREVRRLLGSTPLFSVQSEYNLFERGPEESLIPYCEGNNILFIAYSPLDQGHVVWSASVRNRLVEIAATVGLTPAQVALNFLASRGPVLPIPKAMRESHIRENATACDFELSGDLCAVIDRECRVPALHVPWTAIRPARDVSGGRAVYTTLEEARVNPAGHAPSPLKLAEDIRSDDRIKPVRVTPIADASGEYRYDLVEGRLRFWAWVLAFEGRREVPVMVRD